MFYTSEQERRNDAVYAEHKRAVAAGEKRVLRTTSTGELHSYPGEEIGFTPGRGQAQVSTWWGMAIICTFMGLMFLGSLVMLIVTLLQGHGEWGALFPILLGAFGFLYAFALSRDEYRASQLRKRRGSPKPGTSGRVDINLLELGQKHRDEQP
ncbi:hypothetical protein LJR078_000730 [Arthrobacter sp. LjRoot78]|uniref:hypothetical protein n=1 Tax=Arthrobacter sp. LjRoot78 TaxID=3342338 RepID=UPI003ED00525